MISMDPNINIIGVGDAGLGAILYLLENNTASLSPRLITSPEKLDERASGVRQSGRNISLISIKPSIEYSELTYQVYTGFPQNELTFIVAGLGGPFSSQVVPKLAEISSKLSKKTTLFGIMPFSFEGEKRKKVADKTFAQLKNIADECIELKNQDLFKRANENTSFTEAFEFFNSDILAYIKRIEKSSESPC